MLPKLLRSIVGSLKSLDNLSTANVQQAHMILDPEAKLIYTSDLQLSRRALFEAL
jgi:hypothetical protein